MKRKAIWFLAIVILVMITCTVAGARTVFGPGGTIRYSDQERVRWSTMAGGYIDSDFRWSTLRSKHVHRNCRWSMLGSKKKSYSAKREKKASEQLVEICQQRASRPRSWSRELKLLRQNDGKEVIRKYLESKGALGHFRMDQGFSVRGKTISVNFVFKHKKIIIKFCDPQGIASLTGVARRYFDGYLSDWQAFQLGYEGKVYLIRASGKEAIEKGLESVLSHCFQEIEEIKELKKGRPSLPFFS